MNKCVLYAFTAFACFSAVQPNLCRADSLLIGQIEYDIVNPTTGGVPGTNAFDLYNLTGANAAGPESIADNISFSGTLTLSTSVSANPIVVNFSGVDDTGANSTLYSLSSSVDVYSALLTLVLSNSQGVNIYDSLGNAAVANLQAVADTGLVPVDPATTLAACDGSGSSCAAAAIYVDTAPTTAVTPEPETIWLVLSGLGGALAYRRRLHIES